MAGVCEAGAYAVAIGYASRGGWNACDGWNAGKASSRAGSRIARTWTVGRPAIWKRGFRNATSLLLALRNGRLIDDGGAPPRKPLDGDNIKKAHDEFMYPGLGRRPETLQEHLTVLTRQVPRAYGAAAGVAGVNTAVDTLYHGEPWQTAAWRHLGGGRNGNPPPSWWPQPPPDEKPLPPSGPQPPSQLREGW